MNFTAPLTKPEKRGRIVAAFTAAALLATTGIATAGQVDVAVVDLTAPTDEVTVAAGGSASITINLSVTGNQAGDATFKVYRDWSSSGGTSTASNPQQFSVPARAANDAVTTFTTTGSVSVATAQAGGTFTLAVGAFDITNTNSTGAKLEAGSLSNYEVTVPGTTSNSVPSVNAPSFNATGPCTVTATATFTDPDANTWTATVNWGDGTLAGAASVNQTTKQVTRSHTYATAGTYQVRVTVNDGLADGQSALTGYTTRNSASAVLDPMKAGGASVFKLGSNVPVKITVTACGRDPVTTLSPTVALVKIDSSASPEAAAPVEVVEATNGKLMTWDGEQYHFGLSSKKSQFTNSALSAGTYEVRISDTTLWQVRTARFDLK